MPISKEQFREMEVRCAANSNRKRADFVADASGDAVPDGEEGRLHEAIEADLRERRWLYHHDRMDKASTGSPIGRADFIIFPPHKNALMVECKTKTAKLTPEQLAYKLVAELSGYKYVVVRSLSDYQTAVNE